MGDAQQRLENGEQGASRAPQDFGRRLLVPQQRLGEFQIPVAVLVPGEIVNGGCIKIESIRFHRALGDGHQVIGARQDPAVGQAQGGVTLEIGIAGVGILAVHLNEPSRVPQLVAEVAVAVDPVQVEAHVAAGAGQGAEREAQRVGAVGGNAVGEILARLLLDARRHLRLGEVFGALLHQRLQADTLDEVQRVQPVALGLGHLLAVGIPHQAVDVHLVKRHLTGELQRHHDHPRDPEEDDVVAGDQHVGRVVEVQLAGFIGPPQGGERPQRRGKPRLQHVGVLSQADLVAEAVLRPGLFFGARHIDVAGRVVERRNAMPPPLLARYAPVLNVAHPGEVDVFVLLRHELHVAVLHRRDGRPRQRLDLDEPLVGEQRLDDGAGAVTPWYHQGVIEHTIEQALGVEVGDHALPGGEAIEATVGLRRLIVDGGVFGEDVDQRQLVAGANFMVIEIVGRGDLHAAGAELHVDISVGDDGNLPADQRQAHALAHQLAVAFVVRMHGNRAVAQHGLRARGGDHQIILAVGGGGAAGERVAEVPQLTLLFGALHLQVGDRGFQLGIPVHQPLAAVDEPFIVQADEHLQHRVRKACVHGEAFAAPVQRRAHAAQLARDAVAGLRLPLPHPVDECLATNVVAILAFGIELPLHQHLGGDAGVIGAHLPQGAIAFHAVIADQGIHQRVLKGVPHVQAPGDVRRWDDDAVGRPVAGWREIARVLPLFVQLLLDAVGIETMLHPSPRGVICC